MVNQMQSSSKYLSDSLVRSLEWFGIPAARKSIQWQSYVIKPGL